MEAHSMVPRCRGFWRGCGFDLSGPRVGML